MGGEWFIREQCEKILQNCSHNLKEKVLGTDICRNND